MIGAHLDDAVFSCGTLIAAQQVTGVPPLIVTVFSGWPAEGATHFDKSAGFASSRVHMIARRREDEDAAAVLGAEVLHLNLLDDQYARGVDESARAALVEHALAPIFATASTDIVACPAGIRHPDHKLVATASKPSADWVYEDLPYYVLWPENVTGFPPPTLTLPSCEAKERAIRCYKSQLGGEPGEELRSMERYHRYRKD